MAAGGVLQRDVGRPLWGPERRGKQGVLHISTSAPAPPPLLPDGERGGGGKQEAARGCDRSHFLPYPRKGEGPQCRIHSSSQVGVRAWQDGGGWIFPSTLPLPQAQNLAGGKGPEGSLWGRGKT